MKRYTSFLSNITCTKYTDNLNGPIERSKTRKAVIKQAEGAAVVKEKNEETLLPLLSVADAEEERR
jgi:hypothetical protein